MRERETKVETETRDRTQESEDMEVRRYGNLFLCNNPMLYFSLICLVILACELYGLTIYRSEFQIFSYLHTPNFGFSSISFI